MGGLILGANIGSRELEQCGLGEIIVVAVVTVAMPFIINIKGGTGNRAIVNGGYFVVIVGYQNVVFSDLSSLSANNFLIIDPGPNASLKIASILAEASERVEQFDASIPHG